jgi:hypothetical protein
MHFSCPLLCTCHMFRPSHFSWLVTRIIFGEE